MRGYVYDRRYHRCRCLSEKQVRNACRTLVERGNGRRSRGRRKVFRQFHDFNPTDKRSYEIVPAGDLDVNLEFTKGKGKLAEVVYVTIRYGANEKTELLKEELLKDVYGKNFELGKNVGKIEIIFEFKTANERDDNRDDNEYMGATADFVLKITSKTVEEAK